MGHKNERKAREAFGHDGFKEKFDERRSGGTSKIDIPRIRDLDGKICGEQMGLLEGSSRNGCKKGGAETVASQSAAEKGRSNTCGVGKDTGDV